ncbi:PREDICTED: DNA-directed RNA polymerase III subunit RPC8 [Nicrophorus vespilloides]|uniref:DNA-directed RNA polymerase III subunit RPC8 n=1 Tax=Nicrophorus vespilloides TaxID=110193 RepID=A0ABM1M9B9_NICVS|nr:PREDICTED: DNA-directed RNA polymerase III subunit RPC8 [Nicrophorus vespilloides]
MYILAEMENVTRIPPDVFNLKLNTVIARELDKKLANKVVLNVGLCIALHDITKLQDSFIFPGDGASHTRVTFRYIVFRPFVEEILLGKIRSCTKDGVQVSMGFFDDIIIPPSALQHPSRFDETEQAWIWEYDLGDGEKHDLFMDAGETVRFRVTAETFKETCPTQPNTQVIKQENSEGTENKIPYLITGSINEPGLGLLTWWDN